MSTDRKLRAGESLRTSMRQKGRKRREALANRGAIGSDCTRNDLLPHLELVQIDPKILAVPKRNVRVIDPEQIRRVIHSISTVGVVDPVLIDEENAILDGVIVTEAAKRLGLPTIPCVRAAHLTEAEKRVVRLALNRLGEKGKWNLPELKAELIELLDEGIQVEDTAFTLAEFDQISIEDEIEPVERGQLTPLAGVEAISEPGDVFVFASGHRLKCGDSTNGASYQALMEEQQPRLVLTDQPYNVPIAGHVTKSGHRDFIMASGEMSPEQFLVFNRNWIKGACENLCDGGLIGTFIDWRGYPAIDFAALELGLTPINLIVWSKTNAGMGSLYRSQHELFPLYKKGDASHINNVALGKNGRSRTNVWSYPGASSIGSDSRKGLQLHPTVKPAAMCADAILDVTNRGDIVLDPFLGSGSTLIAAQSVGRRCYGMELDPRYVDVAIKRYQEVYGESPTLLATGENYEELVRRRKIGPSQSNA